MENQEEKQNIDSVDGKITTFVSPAVLATILDRESLNEDANIHDTMIDTNEQEPDQENLQDSLEFSLNDSLELRNLQEFGVAEPAESTVQKGDPLEFTEQVLVFPKTSTPSQKTNKSNGRTVEKASRERRPQHIIERNKENVGKRMPSKTSYAQMHATKAKNKLDNKRDEKSRTKQVGEKSPNVTSGSDSGLVNQPELLEEVNNDLDQSANSYGDASQTQNDLGYPVHDTQEGDLPPDSVLNGTLHAYHNQHHGPYYDVSQTSNVYHNAYESGYSYQPVSYTRGYQSAVANLRQSHAMAGPISSLQYNPLSTQSAPPGGYGYYRKPLDIHHLHEEDYYNNLSSALPNTDFVNSDKGNQIPEPSLHRKFSSEPHLVQSSSPSLQKMENVGRDSKASGSYSSLRQPFQYKPYTLKDYRNIAGSNVEHLAGGLGPNVDTDQFKEKVVCNYIVFQLSNWE